MTALATTTNVAASLGRSLVAGDETTRATSMLLTASRAVERTAGYRFLPGSYTIKRITTGDLRLELPGDVATIAQVRDIDQYDGAATILTLTTDYTVRGSRIYLMQYHAELEIDFTTTAAVPDEIVTLVANMVARSLAGPPVGASSESAGPFSISYVNTSGDVYLSKTDKLILGGYKQIRPAVAVIRS